MTGASKGVTIDQAHAGLDSAVQPIYRTLVDDYKALAKFHHGSPFVSGPVLADLVRIGWRKIETTKEKG